MYNHVKKIDGAAPKVQAAIPGIARFGAASKLKRA